MKGLMNPGDRIWTQDDIAEVLIETPRMSKENKKILIDRLIKEREEKAMLHIFNKVKEIQKEADTTRMVQKVEFDKLVKMYLNERTNE